MPKAVSVGAADRDSRVQVAAAEIDAYTEVILNLVFIFEHSNCRTVSSIMGWEH